MLVLLNKNRGFIAAIVLTTATIAWSSDDYVIPPAKKNHWAWKPPVRPAVPTVKNKAWVKNPIDAFILAKLEGAGLKPAPPATREQMIRRVTFDLIGLPPTPQEIDAFVNDKSPNAWEKVIDRLLASPHYGERWGRHWLDVARFAESNGFEHDEVRPDAWRYRDYVIKSFNDDKPYDRFIKEQIAGDLLKEMVDGQWLMVNGNVNPQPSTLNPSDLLIATGFNLLGPDMTDAADQKQRRQNTLNDMTDVTGLAFLGMTVACARCHDHKFEPIPQKDYYRLQAFFTSAAFRRDLPISTPEQRAAYEAAMKEYNALVKPTQDKIAQLEEPYRQRLYEAKLSKLSDDAQVAHKTPPDKRTPTQNVIVAETERLVIVSPTEILNAMNDADKAKRKELGDELKTFDSKKPASLPVAMGLSEGAAARTFLLERGELNSSGEEVQAGFPIIVAQASSLQNARGDAGATRMALANWVASPDNPLTARVMVNRIWQHHFGRGIVPTPSDFGTRGEPPTHPELLDWLAITFVSTGQLVNQSMSKSVDQFTNLLIDSYGCGWSIKKMHKLMLMSATYQQSTINHQPLTIEKDSDNRLFSRMNRLRLEGEVIRDSLLFISGRLNPKMGGPSVFPPIPADALQGVRGWMVSPDPQDYVRRSVYIFARRNLRFPFLEAFDLPDTNLSCPKRERSTTAPQALTLLNSSDVMEAAKGLTSRVMKEAKSNDERITLAYRLTLGRRPSETEMKLSREFLKQSPLSELCRALLNVNEFVYVD
jgi:hypothetical protein